MLQQALFGNEELGKSEDDEMEGVPSKPTKADYYAAMSSLQKFVRRGMAEEAKAAARIMFNVSPYKLKRRFGIIVLEDIGVGDLNVTLDVSKALKQSKISWSMYESLIDKCCSCVKSRDADDAFFLFKEEEKGFAIPFDGVDRIEFDWIRQYVNVEDRWSVIENLAKERSERLASIVVELKSFDDNWFGPNLSLLCIYRWNDEIDWIKTPSVIVNDAKKNLVMHNRYVCNVGLDYHTRYGKFVIKIAAKRFGVEEYALYVYHFALISGLLDRAAVFSTDYQSVYRSTALTMGGDPSSIKEASSWVSSCVSLAAKSYEDDRRRQFERGEFMK